MKNNEIWHYWLEDIKISMKLKTRITPYAKRKDNKRRGSELFFSVLAFIIIAIAVFFLVF